MFCFKLISVWIVIVNICNTHTMANTMKWIVPSGEFVNGHDALLSCDKSNCEHNTRKWLGGNEYLRLPCTNENSVFPNKYVYKENDKNTFSLMVKHATYEDYISRYSCSCGFHHYPSTIEEQNVTYVYIPNIDEVGYKFEVQKGRLIVHLNISLVSPIPECDLYIKDVPIKRLELITKKEKVNGAFSDLQFTRIVDANKHSGHENVTVKCTIFKQFDYELSNLVNFEAYDEKRIIIWHWVVLSIAVFVAVVLLTAIFIRVWRQVQRKGYKSTQQILYTEHIK